MLPLNWTAFPAITVGVFGVTLFSPLLWSSPGEGGGEGWKVTFPGVVCVPSALP